jgi:hypothetical protein
MLTEKARHQYRQATLPKLFEQADSAGITDRVMKELKERGDTIVVTDQAEAHFYVVVLDKRIEPQADDPSWIKKFREEVTEISVNHTPLADYVLRELSPKFLDDWNQQLLKQARFNEENAKRLAEEFRASR